MHIQCKMQQLHWTSQTAKTQPTWQLFGYCINDIKQSGKDLFIKNVKEITFELKPRQIKSDFAQMQLANAELTLYSSFVCHIIVYAIHIFVFFFVSLSLLSFTSNIIFDLIWSSWTFGEFKVESLFKRFFYCSLLFSTLCVFRMCFSFRHFFSKN